MHTHALLHDFPIIVGVVSVSLYLGASLQQLLFYASKFM